MSRANVHIDGSHNYLTYHLQNSNLADLKSIPDKMFVVYIFVGWFVFSLTSLFRFTALSQHFGTRTLSHIRKVNMWSDMRKTCVVSRNQ